MVDDKPAGIIFACIDIDIIFGGADIAITSSFFNDVAALDAVEPKVEEIVVFAWFSVDNAEICKKVNHLLCIVNDRARSR